MDTNTKEDSIEKRWITGIRYKLQKKIKEKGYTNEQLADRLTSKFGFVYSSETVRNAVAYNGVEKPNMMIVLGLCELLEMNYAELLSYPHESNYNDELVTNNLPKDVFVPLEDPKYMGHFFGYCYPINVLKRDGIRKFELDIEQENNKKVICNMKYWLKYTDTTDRARDQLQALKYSGPVIHSIPTKTITIHVTNESGQFCILVMNYQWFNTSKLWFRKGIMISPSFAEGHPPVSMSFLLFRKDVLSVEKAKPLIEGLLKNPSSTIYVPKKEMESLLSENHEALNKFWNYYAPLIEKNNLDVYEINEEIFLNKTDIRNGPSAIEAAESLARIRAISIEDPRKVYFDNAPYAELVKDRILMIDSGVM